MKGMLIAIDGLDLTGKTSHVLPYVTARLSEVCVVKHAHTIYDSEFGDTIGKMLSERNDMNAGVAALLFGALRLDVMNREVCPALEQGNIVITDRFNLSTEVYQADCGFVDKLVPIMSRGVPADCTIFCDIDYTTYLERLQNNTRGVEMDSREKDLVHHFEEKRQLYLDALNGDHHGVIYRLDCNTTPFKLHERLDPIVDNIIRAYRSLNRQ